MKIMKIMKIMKNWYLIYTKSRREQIASQNLSVQGYEVFCPFLSVKKRTAQGWRQVSEALFPSYLFIYLDDQFSNWKPIRSTLGVRDFVRFGNQLPAIVPLSVMDILQKLDTHSLSELWSQQPKVGDSITVSIGEGLVQALVQAVDAHSRVLVLFELLGQDNQIWVELEDVIV